LLRKITLGFSVLAVALVLVTVITATTATNTVPFTRAGLRTEAVTANDLKPTECAALNLRTVLIAESTGKTDGTRANELILGGPGDQSIAAGRGNDCVLGGGGADTLDGEDGNDVCIGNAFATFKDCETVVIQ
jgi:Ca2+-binding RTX toxin-like protein